MTERYETVEAPIYVDNPAQSITSAPIENPMQYIDTDDPNKVKGFRSVNAQAYLMYQQILQCCPRSAERTLAIRKLQEARMWANAAIVFDGRTYPT
jgi:hypothetical protein